MEKRTLAISRLATWKRNLARFGQELDKTDELPYGRPKAAILTDILKAKAVIKALESEERRLEGGLGK